MRRDGGGDTSRVRTVRGTVAKRGVSHSVFMTPPAFLQLWFPMSMFSFKCLFFISMFRLKYFSKIKLLVSVYLEALLSLIIPYVPGLEKPWNPPFASCKLPSILQYRGWNVKWFHKRLSPMVAHLLFIIHAITEEKHKWSLWWFATLRGKGWLRQVSSGSASTRQNYDRTVNQNKAWI